MTPLVTFSVRGIPQSQGSKRAFIPRGSKRAVVVENNAKLRPWRADVVAAASAAYSAQPVAGPVALRCVFYFERPKSHTRKQQAAPWKDTKPDLSKLVRGVEDALKGLIWGDDAQVVQAVSEKRYAEGEHLPGVEVTVGRIE